MPKSGKGKAMRVTLYYCKSCGNKYRKASRLDTPPPTLSEMKISPPTTLSENISTKVSADIPITSAASISQAPDRPVAPDDAVENTHRASLFERIKRAFTG